MVNPNIPDWVWTHKFHLYTMVEFPTVEEKAMEDRAVNGECFL